MQHRLNLANNMLDNSLYEIKALHFSLINDPVLQQLMKEQKTNNGKLTLNDLVKMETEMNRIGYHNANVRSIIAISCSGKVIDPIYGVAPYTSIVNGNPEFQYFLSSQLSGRFSVPSTFPMQIKNPDYSDCNTITYFGHYSDRETYEDLGYIAINLTKYSIFNEFDRQFSESFDRAYVTDENRNIVLETAPLSISDLPTLRADYKQGTIVKLDNRPYAVFSLHLSNYPNWRIVGFMDYQSILSPVNKMYFTIFIVTGILLLLIIFISFSISQHITKPIGLLGSAMDKVGHGAWLEVEPLDTKDEISRLFDGFNNMVRSLHRLTKTISDEEKAKKKIEVAMVQSKLDLLQSQINPHFIHNTLNTIKFMAKKEGNDELADLITSFNALLRTSMSQNNMMITMLEEADNLYNYIKIQMHRYDVDLEFKCDISKNASGVLIPKLILQPLVENSLFYGIIPKGSGKIVVSARTGDGRLWINVWDNGAGIPPDKLALILSDDMPKARGYNQIGLANVNERLELNYGASSHIVVQSELGKGTSVGFSIPIDDSFSDDSVYHEEQ